MTVPPPPPSIPAGAGDTSENNNGVVALVTGILGLLVCPIVLSIVAIVFGKKGLESAAAGRADNGGMAKAGYILGIIGLILGIIGVVVWIVLIALGVAIGGSTT